MKALVSIVALLFTATTWAHVTPGHYKGKDQNGAECSFTVGNEWFENNQPHPLNERLPIHSIQFAGADMAAVTWNVAHPAIVDADKGLVRFNHDYFYEVVATKTGAASLMLLKSAEEAPEGHAPTGLIYIEDNYRNRSESVKFTCTL